MSSASTGFVNGPRRIRGPRATGSSNSNITTSLDADVGSINNSGVVTDQRVQYPCALISLGVTCKHGGYFDNVAQVKYVQFNLTPLLYKGAIQISVASFMEYAHNYLMQGGRETTLTIVPM